MVKRGRRLNSIECSSFIERAADARTVEDIHGLCSSLTHAVGFDYFIFAATFPVSLIKPLKVIVSGYPDDWRKHYLEFSYAEIDPTVTHCMSHVTPLCWDRIDVTNHARRRSAKRFMSEASDFGLRSGASFPVHGCHGEAAMFSLASGEDHHQMHAHINEALPYVQLLTSYIHEAVRKICEGEGLPIGKVELTLREKECLTWAAEGKTTWEISQIISVSERTVLYHLQNATQKLDGTNRQHAVAKAVTQAVITPQFN